MKILVTGGLGFIGSHLVDKLIKKKHKIFVIDNLSSGSKKNINLKATYLFVDLKTFISDEKKLKDFLISNKIETIYHLAANASVNASMSNPLEIIEENFRSSVVLIQASKKTFVKKFLFASTSAVYGEPLYFPVDESHPVDPISVYGLSKLIFEKFLKFFKIRSNISIVIFRLPNVYGERQRSDLEGGVVAIFNDNIKANKNITIFGDGMQKRDWVHVSDIVKAFTLTIEIDIKFEIISLGSEVGNTVNYLFKLLKTKNLYKKIPNIEVKRDGDIKDMTMSYQKAKKILGWKPSLTLKQGLELTK